MSKVQTKVVSVYWTPEYLEELDKVCERLSVRRNEFIKRAVEEALTREGHKDSSSPRYLKRLPG